MSYNSKYSTPDQRKLKAEIYDLKRKIALMQKRWVKECEQLDALILKLKNEEGITFRGHIPSATRRVSI